MGSFFCAFILYAERNYVCFRRNRKRKSLVNVPRINGSSRNRDYHNKI